jgi:hypothetical protein
MHGMFGVTIKTLGSISIKIVFDHSSNDLRLSFSVALKKHFHSNYSLSIEALGLACKPFYFFLVQTWCNRHYNRPLFESSMIGTTLPKLSDLSCFKTLEDHVRTSINRLANDRQLLFFKSNATYHSFVLFLSSQNWCGS